MSSIRNYLMVCISLISMFVSMFFLMIIFLPHSSLLPESALLAELQEVGPLLLSPFTGDDHLSYLKLLNHAIGVPAQDDPNMSANYQQPVSSYSSPDLLLIALAKYVGVLGFSKTDFFETMYIYWNIVMMTCIFFSLLHFSVSFLMLLYISLCKRHPKLLLPWICFTILVLAVVLTSLVSMMIAMATSLTLVQVQDAHCYTIVIACLTSMLLYAEIFLVMTQFKQEQRAVSMALADQQIHVTPTVGGQGSLTPGVEQDSLESVSYWESCSDSWTSSATSGPSTQSVSTQPPTYDQVLQNQKPLYARLSFDETGKTIPQIPNFHSLPLSSFLGQPHSEVPVFYTNHQPWYLPPNQPYPEPQPYPGHSTNQLYPDPQPYQETQFNTSN